MLSEFANLNKKTDKLAAKQHKKLAVSTTKKDTKAIITPVKKNFDKNNCA